MTFPFTRLPVTDSPVVAFTDLRSRIRCCPRLHLLLPVGRLDPGYVPDGCGSL